MSVDSSLHSTSPSLLLTYYVVISGHIYPLKVYYAFIYYVKDILDQMICDICAYIIAMHDTKFFIKIQEA